MHARTGKDSCNSRAGLEAVPCRNNSWTAATASRGLAGRFVGACRDLWHYHIRCKVGPFWAKGHQATAASGEGEDHVDGSAGSFECGPVA
eukprot:364205-Chlamydomonas_euryale.AAC.3